MSSDGSRLTTAQRLGIAGLCVVALVGCGFLAWWQWTRYSSAGGTIQNLGYMLQWPLFGLFPIFLVWRIRKLARAGNAAEPAPAGAESVAAHAASRPRRRLGYVAPTVSTDRQDPTLAEYNRYLAELHEHAEGR